MASPSTTELETQWKNGVALLENLRSANTVAANLDTYQQSLESDFAASQALGAQIVRDATASALAAAPQVLEPILRAYAFHGTGRPANDASSAIDRVYRYFHENNKHVKSRGFSWGSITAASGNTGTGNVRRLNKDENNYDLDAQFPDTKRLLCTRDESGGAERFREEFELTGGAEGVDALSFVGSNAVARPRSKSSVDSLVGNPTFSSYTITGSFAAGLYTLTSGDTLTNWTLLDKTLAQLDQNASAIYRSVPGDSTPTALRFLGNNTLSQAFSIRPIRLDRQIPVDLLVPCKRESNADGTLTVGLGATSKAFTVSSLTNGAYNACFLDLDQGLWPRRISETSPDLTIAWSGRSTGTLVFDEITLVTFDLVDGSWWVIHAGPVQWLAEDSFTAADSIASDAPLGQWMHRAFRRHLPNVPNATQVTASGGRTLTFATAGDTITASSGSFVTDGYKVGMKLTVAGSASNNGTYTITVVTATVITVSENLVNEGPVSATTTLDATAAFAYP